MSNPPLLEFSNQIMEYIFSQEQAPYILLFVDQGDSFSVEAAQPLREWCAAKLELICVHATPESEFY